MRKYSIVAALASVIVMATVWHSCTRDNSLEDITTAQTDPQNIIGISADSYSKPQHWSGKDQPITWINNDSKIHSVTADDGSFDSGPIQPGKSFTKEFSQPGEYSYHDNYSPARASLTIFGREDP